MIVNNNGKLLLECTTPIGRLVQGDAHKPSDKDMHGAPLVIKNGPNKGQPRVEYFAGVAFQKGVAEVEALRAEWTDFLRQCWPHLYQGPGGSCTLPGGISDKWIDGDGYDTTGKAWATREGFVGHWVLRASSGFAPQVYAAGDYRTLLGAGSVKLGAFVRINVTAESNLQAQKPGIFVNLRMIELCGMGAAIIRGPDPTAAFSQPAGALPPGATAIDPTALTRATAPPPPPPAAAAPPAPPPAPPPPVAAPHNPIAAAEADGWIVHPSAPGNHYKGQEVVADAALAARYPAPAAAPPYHGYAQTPPAPPPAPPAPPPPPAAPAAPPAPPPPPPLTQQGPIMTAQATGTYEQYTAAGWTDQQLIASGLMLPAAGVQ